MTTKMTSEIEQIAFGVRSASPARPKVGLLTGGLGAYWRQFDGLLDQVQASTETVRTRLRDMGAEVVDIGVVSDADDGHAGARSLSTERCDLLIVFVASYMTSGQVIAVARECNVPVLLLELQPETKMDHATAGTGDFLRFAGVAGLPELCNVFERCGVDHGVIVGHLGDEAVWQRVGTWVRAAGVVTSLRYARFGLMGHLYPGMLDIQTNLTSLTRSLGGHIEIIEVDDLRVAVEACSEERVEQAVARVHRDFELLEGYSPEHLEFQARTAAGMAELIRDLRLDGLAYFHFGRGGDIHEKIASGMAVGGSFAITDGVPVGTEFDLRAVIAMYMLNRLGASTWFTELYSVNYDDGVVEVGHDGATNLAHAWPKARIRPLEKFHGKSGSGNAVEATAAPGPVTHLALGELGDGSLRLVVGEGHVVDGPVMKIGNTVSRVDFGCTPGAWVEAWSRSGSGHHFAMGTGHHADEVEVLGELLGIDVVRVRP
jgi:L-arabinose isomerase